MSTARNRFGVSILVGFILTVMCMASTSIQAAQFDPAPRSMPGASSQEHMFSVAGVMTAASTRTQLVIGAGATIPLLVAGFMVRRRILADL
jgi:hypothetical protein